MANTKIAYFRTVIAALVLLTGTAPSAAGKPMALFLSPSAQSVTEGGTAVLSLTKSGGNGQQSSAKITTSDGSVSLSVYPGSSFSIPTKDDAVVQGTRNITVTATATTGAKASATVTILDNDVAPPPPPPPPPPPTGAWVAAPLTVGGYAWPKSQGPCCNGLVFKIIDGGLTLDADPTKQQHWWLVQYYSDTSGNYPATSPYWQSVTGYQFDESLSGLAPQ